MILYAIGKVEDNGNLLLARAISPVAGNPILTFDTLLAAQKCIQALQNKSPHAAFGYEYCEQFKEYSIMYYNRDESSFQFC